MIRVVIVDNEPLIRTGIQHVLCHSADLDVPAAVPVRDAVEAIRAEEPEVVLLDACTTDAETLAAGLATVRRPPRVCVLSRSAEEEHIALALAAGACGYVLKSTPPDEFPPLVRFLAAGWTMTSGAISANLTRHFLAGVARDARTAPLAQLTRREREVLALVGRGLSNTAIAARLHLGTGTVKDHVSSILAKLHVPTRIEAALLADRADLLTPGSSGG
ncbi:response regulator transcription factor [Streptomyces sp. NPDC020607]|uniref:response regulator transcription factor n=1 Tax=Streptomyces sp. NPDC020607 TaxID=3365082 RepID=UPI00379B63E4